MNTFNKHTYNSVVAAILCLLASCTHTTESRSITSQGVVRIKTDVLDSLNLISKVLNPVIIETINHETLDSLNYDTIYNCFCFSNDIKSRAYYPTHSVIYFDGEPASDGRYKILFNNEWHYIDSNNNFAEYMPWKKFLLNVPFFDIEPGSNLYSRPNSGSDIISIERQNIYFQPLKVECDWVYVDIINGEDIFSPIGRGWIRWRNGNEFLLKTLYLDI